MTYDPNDPRWTGITAEMRGVPSMTTTKGPTHAEKVADAVLQAAGSGFKYYMPDTKARIVEAAAQAMEQQSETSGLREALKTADDFAARFMTSMACAGVVPEEYSNDALAEMYFQATKLRIQVKAINESVA